MAFNLAITIEDAGGGGYDKLLETLKNGFVEPALWDFRGEVQLTTVSSWKRRLKPKHLPQQAGEGYW